MVTDVARITWSITPTSSRKNGTTKPEVVNQISKYYSREFLPVVHLRIERKARDDGQEIAWKGLSAAAQLRNLATCQKCQGCEMSKKQMVIGSEKWKERQIGSQPEKSDRTCKYTNRNRKNQRTNTDIDRWQTEVWTTSWNISHCGNLRQNRTKNKVTKCSLDDS